MKKYWRCHVCNDIHYGVKPPEICPTCLVKNAYVEVATQEAQKIMNLTTTTIDKEAFVSAIEKFAEKSHGLEYGAVLYERPYGVRCN